MVNGVKLMLPVYVYLGFQMESNDPIIVPWDTEPGTELDEWLCAVVDKLYLHGVIERSFVVTLSEYEE